MEKNRIAWVDIAKGIAIIAMIIGHGCPKQSVISFIFSFHMPLFFILSGYTSGQVTTWKIFRQKGINAFLRVWLLAVLMIILLGFETFIFNNAGGRLSLLDITLLDLKGIFWGSNIQAINLMNVGVMWFLIVFFWSKILYNFFQICFDNKYNGLLLGILSYFSFIISKIHWLPQALDIVPIAAFFMWCGWYLRKVNGTIDYNNSLIILILVGSVFVYWIAFVQKGLYIDMSVRHYPNFIFSILEAVAGTICVCFISASLLEIKKVQFLSILGKHTLALLCIHHLDLFWIWWGKLIPQWYVTLTIRLILDLTILCIYLFIRKQLIIKRGKFNE